MTYLQPLWLLAVSGLWYFDFEEKFAYERCMDSPTPPLTEPPVDSPIAEGMSWAQGAALGSTATILAVIAVAAIGLLMLSGRLELRRGITVVLGCFILFGASSIASALTGFARAGIDDDRRISTDAGQLSGHLQSPPLPPTAYDPYAGASVPAAR